MTLLQAILIGMVYWMSTWSFFYGSTSIINRPMACAMWTGLILGDIKTGLMVGALVEPLYLAFTGAGGTVTNDRPAAGIIPTVVVIASGQGASGAAWEAAVALSVTVSLLMAQMHTLRRIVAATWVQMADNYAEKLDIRGIRMAGLVYTTLFKVALFWVPMTVIVYMGTATMAGLMTNMPIWLMRGFEVVGKMLPALGFAMTINVIGRRDLIPYFLAGFFFIKYTNFATMPAALLALFLAFVHLNIISRDRPEDEEDILHSSAEHQIDENKRILDKKDVTRMWLWWWFACEASNSFQRLQSLAYCICMIPSLKKLYGNNEDELREGLKRHLIFFNTQGIWGAVIHGIVLSMEEQRALGAPITIGAITGIKSGLMGPFAGIGDTIDWSTLQPLAWAMFIPVAATGNPMGVFAPWLIVFSVTWIEGYYFTHLGYRLGSRAALNVLQSGQVQRIITFLSVLGLFMMGVLSASMVDLQLLPHLNNNPEMPWLNFYFQFNLLNAIAPGILPIALIFVVYWYLNKGGGNMQKATIWILIIGLLGGIIGLFGFPVRPTKPAASLELIQMVEHTIPYLTNAIKSFIA